MSDGETPAEPVVRDADRALLAEPSRQSLGAIVFFALGFLRRLNIFQIGIPVYLLISGRLSAQVVGLVVVGLMVWAVAATVSWWRFTFLVDGDELKVSRGLISLQRLAIPLDRVQSVSVEEPLLHRLVGLVKVSVDTAGSQAAEFVLEAISPAKAAALQRLTADFQTEVATTARRAGSPGLDAPPPTEPPDGTLPPPPLTRAVPAFAETTLIKRTPGDLVRVGLSRWPLAGLLVFGPLLALGADAAESFSDRLGRYLPDEAEIEQGLAGLSTTTLLVAITVILLIATAAGWLLQIARAVITEWDLTITRTAEGLRRDVGLLNRTSKASRLRRVQSLQWRQSPMENLLGISRLRLKIIGEGDLTIPGSNATDHERLRAEVFDPAAGPAPEPVEGVSFALVALAARNAAVVIVLAVAAMAAAVRLSPDITWSWWMVAVPILVATQVLITYRRWRCLRWGVSPGRLVHVEQIATRSVTELETVKVQMVSVTQSPFQWRRNLASVELSTPEGGVTVPMLENERANHLRDVVLAGVESDDRAWM